MKRIHENITYIIVIMVVFVPLICVSGIFTEISFYDYVHIDEINKTIKDKSYLFVEKDIRKYNIIYEKVTSDNKITEYEYRYLSDLYLEMQNNYLKKGIL